MGVHRAITSNGRGALFAEFADIRITGFESGFRPKGQGHLVPVISPRAPFPRALSGADLPRGRFLDPRFMVDAETGRVGADP